MIEKTEVGAIRDPRDLVREYDEKLAKVPELIEQFEASVRAIERGSNVAGAYGRSQLFCCSTARAYETNIKTNLLKSAWWAAYSWCNMETLATAKDKQLIEDAFENPVPFTEPNLVATFGPYLADQRGVMLRGLAEAFITLDDAYKSHSKVKVGVKGLPKRVIINGARGGFYRNYGGERLRDMLHALKVFDGDGLVPKDIMQDILDEKLLNYRGLEFRWFHNGNVHVHFDKNACRQINLGLAEYYGDVLPDVEPDKSDMKPKAGDTSVSKDLQYFPTPEKAVHQMLSDISLYRVERVLEPSCGCGRIMDGIMSLEGSDKIDLRGIEYDRRRADEARAKGHTVSHMNFLSMQPIPMYDLIAMNPPFYGRHYLKHIELALGLLKPGGKLVSILPATAHYDHKALPEGYHWRDLPVGSFAESGTRVPTGYATWRK